jgi:hypothetical protein
VNLATGAQSILRQDRELFNNPLGVAVVANRPPVPALTATPGVIAAGREVGFDASGSADPEGLQLRYDWDLDGNGSFETPGGTTARITRAYTGTTTLAARVRVSDPHGASAVAAAPVRVDSIRPVLSSLAVHRRSITYRLSEPARVTIQLQRRVKGRWRGVRTLRQRGVAGKNRLRIGVHARAAGGTRRVRYRAEAYAVDAVGNRSRPVRLRVSAAAARRMQRR